MMPILPWVKGMLFILTVATAVEGLIWWRNVHPQQTSELE